LVALIDNRVEAGYSPARKVWSSAKR